MKATAHKVATYNAGAIGLFFRTSYAMLGVSPPKRAYATLYADEIPEKRITATMPADSVHVSSIDMPTAARGPRTTAFSGISTASDLRFCNSVKTGVS